jgi:hypothetical protein
MHVGDEAAAQTVASLRESGFNKLRMLFFLHNLPVEYPDIYPFVRKADGSWDYSRFDPAYFQYVERRLLALQAIGVEADLILFHPYDGGRWGFDRMPLEANLRYLDYLTARLAAFRHVWWSLANEWDDLPLGDWGVPSWGHDTVDVGDLGIEPVASAGESLSGFTQMSFLFSKDDAEIVQGYIDTFGKDKLVEQIVELCRTAEAK